MATAHAFVGGLHRSGTTMVVRLLGRHPDVATMRGTGAPEDEGQHLQSTFPPAAAHGGPGRFAWDPRATLDVPDDPDRARREIERAWAPHWNREDAGLHLEKSPPNLVRLRYLDAVFPGSRFLVCVRHPLTTSMATAKWVPEVSRRRLAGHWARAHRLSLEQARGLGDRVRYVQYESLLADPDRVVAAALAFLGLDPHPLHTDRVDAAVDARYWRSPRSLPWRLAVPRGLADESLDPAVLGYHARRPGPVAPSDETPWLVPPVTRP